jgi:hypothetical protein
MTVIKEIYTKIIEINISLFTAGSGRMALETKTVIRF